MKYPTIFFLFMPWILMVLPVGSPYEMALVWVMLSPVTTAFGLFVAYRNGQWSMQKQEPRKSDGS